ncbi:U4/U6.U5 small nuclear ribonucleoprotein 27 kDa protein-like [Pyrus ussuriensis x Pyrus communis]|uniref:U4/U6.U5 small nuclear ribonucleoprotein 27 kDa protein-like n=1 Tax=Pyrus ussuriensis x Pyrus communis TaxID=2448454 RepID=A0A5N5FPG1_9ROSA|nr:U4/U6.U5 small nuclear ribonucleoprotein 27 kDa protein-like [Pyrus ussuriensis x Pyrus communis]
MASPTSLCSGVQRSKIGSLGLVPRLSIDNLLSSLKLSSGSICYFMIFNCPLVAPPSFAIYNISAISLTFNLVFHSHTRHVEVDYHYVCDKCSNALLIDLLLFLLLCRELDNGVIGDNWIGRPLSCVTSFGQGWRCGDLRNPLCGKSQDYGGPRTRQGPGQRKTPRPRPRPHQELAYTRAHQTTPHPLPHALHLPFSDSRRQVPPAAPAPRPQPLDGATQAAAPRRSHASGSAATEPRKRQRRESTVEDERERQKAAVLDLVEGITKEQKTQQKPSSDGDGGEGMDEDEIEMMKKLGIPTGFDSTKGKPVLGADISGVRAVTKRQPRQYMNRRGGFNRPLPAERNR